MTDSTYKEGLEGKFLGVDSTSSFLKLTLEIIRDSKGQ